jgi:tripartite-type tricarboxylate transporter receptor subunit TctC
MYFSSAAETIKTLPRYVLCPLAERRMPSSRPVGLRRRDTRMRSIGKNILRLLVARGLRGVLLAGLSLAATLLFGPVSHQAAAQPTHSIKIVVPLPPGGAGDIVARLLAEQVGRAHGAAIVTENRPGAGTIIGTESVTRAAPDGGTLLINAPYILINPHLRKVNFDPLTSFEPLCYLVSSPGVIVVNSASPYRTLSELIDGARARPGELTLASVGPGTAQHIGFEMLRRAANVNMAYVPYAGGAPAINALLGGHVTSVFAEYAPLAGHIKAGTLRALATTSRTRIEPLPDLPTVAESGYPDYEVDLWWGLFAPAKTPKEALTQLARWFTEALRAPEVKPKLDAQGFAAVGMCGADFGALLRRQFDHYGRIIREANITPE